MFSFNVGGLTKSEKELLKKMSDTVNDTSTKLDQALADVAAMKSDSTKIVGMITDLKTQVDTQTQLAKELQAKLDQGASTAELSVKVQQLVEATADTRTQLDNIVSQAQPSQ